MQTRLVQIVIREDNTLSVSEPYSDHWNPKGYDSVWGALLDAEKRLYRFWQELNPESAEPERHGP